MSDFQKKINLIREEVNRELASLPIPQKPGYLYDPIRYVLKGKGKRFRPLLVHLMGRALDANSRGLMNLALAVELLHTFTLVHDDIMDKDDTRHGQETLHQKWDESTAILAGDAIFILAQLKVTLVETHVTEVMNYFNQVTLEICEGQAWDKEFENDLSISESNYLDMIDCKTGALLGACAALPAIMEGLSNETVQNLDQFGRLLGKGFQVQDDLLELISNPQQMGKSLGSDLAEGKQTYPIILARTNHEQEWNKCISQFMSKQNEDSMDIVKTFLEKTGIAEETITRYESFFEEAGKVLHFLPEEKRKDLDAFIQLIKNRTY
ncbi:MAG: polyprenyl synthetase family protein [Candidatus Marinimicrobia bacterium]|jgi:geranylgeranyl pyrophosphate synthase|nr:polyprenyl synthetase family protein [Candidatus Neomarinimicrobiota bacterium]MBT3496755.1 polyprenyl synthetase family protein [Candidatus Neomarinimicrobiota bacterium]MBT3732889.1 polyprenyl synthetase family protein [Candidatus Neomarinimicrobiota bacterium]MBT4144764.1 polyprenyl synthetase family protein [Candidatus Neomarinimicrobiota bacterium]MBT4177237.1 polyprenyl synthetase family protein [Candidatus Neomarinimicrobiota bacterium]